MIKIHPFNFKELILKLVAILTIFLCSYLCFTNFRDNNILYGILFLFIVGFLLYVLIINLIQSITFKKDTIFVPKGFTNINNPSESSEIPYSNIKEVKFISKSEDGPHIKGLLSKKNTLLLKLKSNKEFLIDASSLSKKQVNKIINEINNRIKN